jgi:KDO2-lipid IV(A) lauroyltransferase
MWKYYIFRIMGPPLSCLPMKLGYIVARVIADSVYILMPGLRRVIGDNLKHVLGWNVDNSILQRGIRGVLRNTARNYFDLIKVPRLKLNEIEKLITVHGWENFTEAHDRGKGIIIVSAHLGSFDMTSQILMARSVKATVIVETQEPAALLEHVISLRKSKGLTIVPNKLGVLRLLIMALKRGETIGMICDRDIGGDGLETAFFGEKTTLPHGPVRIAMRTGAAIVPAFNLRREDNRYDVYFEPAIDLYPDGEDAVLRNMEQLIDVMEKFIKTCPEQWVVLQPIWENGYHQRNGVSTECPIPSS